MKNQLLLIKNFALQTQKIHAWLRKKARAISLPKKIAAITLTTISLVILHEKLTYIPGYCPATQHYHTDAELINYSHKVLKAEAVQYGGIDGFEKELIRRNIHPEQAGRDFNPNNPSCCEVYRGDSDTQRGCGLNDYPVCVKLSFPPLNETPKGNIYYKREGRTYLYDDCGKLRQSWSIVG